jgi:hypothetical protein
LGKAPQVVLIKRRISHRRADILLKYISYWTNAGSAYWYRTYRNTSYEKTLKVLVDHHKKIACIRELPAGLWWYRKEGDQYFSGISEWDRSMRQKGKNFNSVFFFLVEGTQDPYFNETRLSDVSSRILGTVHRLPLQASRQRLRLCDKAARRLSHRSLSLPKDRKASLKLFQTIFHHPKWNLSYVIHDWLSYMNDNHRSFQNMQVADTFFYSIDRACIETPAPNKSGHLSLQLCMAQPHMTLNSVTMPVGDDDPQHLRQQFPSLSRARNDGGGTFIPPALSTALGKYPFMTSASRINPICILCRPIPNSI